MVVAKKELPSINSIAIAKRFSSNGVYLSPNISPLDYGSLVVNESLSSLFYPEINYHNNLKNITTLRTYSDRLRQLECPINFDLLNNGSGLTAAAGSISVGLSEILEGLYNGILNIKRTYQPSIIKMKRRHGFLARQRSRHGRKIMARRLAQGRRRMCV